MKEKCPLCATVPWLICAGWFLVALFVGETELLADLPPRAPELLSGALAALLLAAFCASAAVRSWSLGLDARLLIGFHLARFAGVYVLFRKANEGAAAFTAAAGWGNLLVAGGALLLLGGIRSKPAVFIWNTAGLLDSILILLAFNSVQDVARLPLSFLPVLFIPWILMTHFIVFMRMRGTLPITSERAGLPGLQSL